MAIKAVKLRVVRKLNSMNLLSLLGRRKHRKLAFKPNSFPESNPIGLLKTENESNDNEKVASPINDSSAPYSTSEEWRHVLPHAHHSTCPEVSSKAVYKYGLQGSNVIDSSQDWMEQRSLAQGLCILFNIVLLILTSELSRVWKRFLEIALPTTLSIKKALTDILFVILDLAFGLFVIMLYSRELSVKPLVLAFDELKLLSTYFVDSRPIRSYSNELRGLLDFFKNSRGFSR
ncbi:hypothetical protein O6H91_08G077100 [Diphasiastrum complanatum]|uniref:Uncharacterized protein n=2 Tax=Diphasiastrum complanatum TaxID=34168 RepID=A0ACC2CZ44_DIPCM|nr:hypothetical protein O6H91_08G076300 [Diphasiastrum complanatum]KAJ7547249.1 hypothetical protein O6H91_08G077100 [Diphasiastrum complanatum]